MKTVSKKSTITIITLSCLLAVAVASTIILAAFSAVRTSTTTITFAEGLTMTLAPKTDAASIKISDAGAGTNTGEFSYSNTGATPEYEEPVTLDGIKATLNKDAWVAYQITLSVETTAQTPVAIAGSWSYTENADVATFTPTSATGNAWQATLNIDHAVWAVSVASNVITVKSKAKLTQNDNLTPAAIGDYLFNYIVIDGTTAGVVNDLAGKKFTAGFVIKAETSYNTVNANPITFS